ncbi:hypothetical protein N9B39_01340, partial [bacterium]|nr:hypothetical protein [bacterium]
LLKENRSAKKPIPTATNHRFSYLFKDQTCLMIPINAAFLAKGLMTHRSASGNAIPTLQFVRPGTPN